MIGYGFDFKQGQRFSLYYHVQIVSGGHHLLSPVGTEVSSLQLKHSEHETDHSPPSSADIYNMLVFTSMSFMCLQGVVLKTHGDPFVSYFIITIKN
jgi:hypothetical protein